eukprot:439753_1
MLTEARKFIPEPVHRVILCKNHIKTINQNLNDNSINKVSADARYVGDVLTAKKEKDAFWYNHNGGTIETDGGYLRFRDEDKFLQILFIEHPLKFSINYNYLHKLKNNKKELLENLKKSIDFIAVTESILHEIMSFLPIKFPIFVSTTTLFRGRTSFTHFTYPHSRSKHNTLTYLKQCEDLFDSKNNWHYIAEYYLMIDDTTESLNIYNKQNDLCLYNDVKLDLQYDNKTLSRKYNEPILVAKRESNKLSDFMHRNPGGGSMWLKVKWTEQDIDFEEIKKHNDIAHLIPSLVDGLNSEIGGDSGRKSRNWHQTLYGKIERKFLPVTVINICN